MMISVVIGKFEIAVYHTLLKIADSCAHLNESGFDTVIKLFLINYHTTVEINNGRNGIFL
jgi:hypothetical protein